VFHHDLAVGVTHASRSHSAELFEHGPIHRVVHRLMTLL
jgi:hypothetical protein